MLKLVVRDAGLRRRQYLDLEHRLAALYAVAASQVCTVDAHAVYKCSVGRAEISKERLRRCYLEQAMMARKKPVVGQAELGVLAPADHKCIVLIETEVPAGLGARHDVE